MRALNHRLLRRGLAMLLALGSPLPAPAAPTAAPAVGAAPVPAAASAPVTSLRIVGGLAGLNQYTRYEAPFWTETLPRLSQGALQAEIVPFDRAGLRGQDTLRLIKLGAVPFGTAMLSISTAPLLGAIDLPGLSPDMATLRRVVAAFRPVMEQHLREQMGIELLALYAYPAQVMFCETAFSSFADLKGRRVRVSSLHMADMVTAMHAIPVLTGFAEIMPKMQANAMDCVVTGTMSGNTIGLHKVTSHLHPMAMSWGLSMFGANGAAWAALPAEQRALIKRQLPQLEKAVWDEADRETGEGIACNRGDASCTSGKRGRMTVLKATDADRRLLHDLLAEVVLPRWVERCGAPCAELWNAKLASATGVQARLPAAEKPAVSAPQTPRK